jgi:hypothetical protein
LVVVVEEEEVVVVQPCSEGGVVVVDGCGPDELELLLVEVDDEIIIMWRCCEVRVVGTPRFFTTLKPLE